MSVNKVYVKYKSKVIGITTKLHIGQRQEKVSFNSKPHRSLRKLKLMGVSLFFCLVLLFPPPSPNQSYFLANLTKQFIFNLPSTPSRTHGIIK